MYLHLYRIDISNRNKVGQQENSMRRIKSFIKEVKVKPLLVMTGVGAVLNYLAKLWLEHSQEKSLYPVPFFEGQLSFSASKLEEYFSYMINQGTFDIYVQTQFIDFLFLATVILVHTLVAILAFKLICRSNGVDVAHLGDKEMNFITKLAVINIVIAPFAGLFDAAENFTLFAIFSDPYNVDLLLANIYSTFAAIKFTVFSISYLWFIVAILYLLFFSAVKLIKKKLSI